MSCSEAAPPGRDEARGGERGVLVVGASATGVQLADEIRRTGRAVTIAVGEHVRLPRTYRGRDVCWWMEAAGVFGERYDEMDDLVRARQPARGADHRDVPRRLHRRRRLQRLRHALEPHVRVALHEDAQRLLVAAHRRRGRRDEHVLGHAVAYQQAAPLRRQRLQRLGDPARLVGRGEGRGDDREGTILADLGCHLVDQRLADTVELGLVDEPLAPVGRPAEGAHAFLPRSKLARLAPGGAHQVHLRAVAAVGGEGDPAAVRRPARPGAAPLLGAGELEGLLALPGEGHPEVAHREQRLLSRVGRGGWRGRGGHRRLTSSSWGRGPRAATHPSA